ncbi:MAG: hypothetical protein HZB62_01440 [Nitrospirae bacterium]|nr:hypothetical protein [Nitrospirota bacterium]
MKTLRIILLSLMLGLLPALAFSATYEVTVDENGPHPAELTILKGDTVRWINRGAAPLSVGNDTQEYYRVVEFNADRLALGGSFEYTFQLPGEFPYRSLIDHDQYGRIIVEGVTISPANAYFLARKPLI